VPAERPTLEQVARLAKASSATVSRVLNKTARVSPELERRVRAAAEAVGFDLQRKSSRLIAFVLGNRPILHPYHSHVLAGAEAYCAERDYVLAFFSLSYPRAASGGSLPYSRIVDRSGMLDGFIVAGTNTQNLLDRLSETGLPVAVFGDTMQEPWSREGLDVVWLDDITGSYEMTRYLQSLGHTRIWFVGNTRLAWFQRRQQGYSRAMQEAGLAPRVESLDSDDEHEMGLLATKLIYSRGEPVDAVIAGNDAICQGIYDALRDGGVEVPGGVSVAGFNDTIEAAALRPPLSTVRAFPERVGRQLAELVLRRIADPSRPCQEITVPTQLVRRESTRGRLSHAVSP